MSNGGSYHWQGHGVLLKGTAGDTLRSPTISTKLQGTASQAVDYPQLVFTTLAHLIEVSSKFSYTPLL